MEFDQHLLDLANYHRWAYERLNTAIDNIPDNDYRKDVGLFFKSIHGTLNHLYLADCLWYSRFNNTIFVIQSLKDELIQDREALKSAMINQADLWIKFVQSNQGKFPRQLSYTNTSGKSVVAPSKAALAHVFNHGTHHRGQISSIITQLGAVGPEIDFLYYILS